MNTEAKPNPVVDAIWATLHANVKIVPGGVTSARETAVISDTLADAVHFIGKLIGVSHTTPLAQLGYLVSILVDGVMQGMEKHDAETCDACTDRTCAKSTVPEDGYVQ